MRSPHGISRQSKRNGKELGNLKLENKFAETIHSTESELLLLMLERVAADALFDLLAPER